MAVEGLGTDLEACRMPHFGTAAKVKRQTDPQRDLYFNETLK